MLNKLPDDATLKQASSFVGEIKTEIDTQRSKLASILTEKGATASATDKMSILIDKVNEIQVGEEVIMHQENVGFTRLSDYTVNIDLEFVPKTLLTPMGHTSLLDIQSISLTPDTGLYNISVNGKRLSFNVSANMKSGNADVIILNIEIPNISYQYS